MPEQQQQQSQRGIDYHRAQQSHLWPFPAFAATWAKLLGRKGGVSALSTQEMELLQGVHQRHPRITQPLLEEACQLADPKTLPVIVYHLQNLLHERNP